MIDLILKADKAFSLFNRGDTVTVALSGGADSVSLLHALITIKDKLGINVNAAHLNHSIRGEEAERDAEFVINFCKILGVELFYEKIDVPKYSEDNHLSIELAARQLRYDFLNRVAIDKIATAHTASDNIETLIFNMSRGTALKGLCGIPPKRDNIIRPVIFCTRKDIENYCNIHNLQFVTDSTNLSDDYSRNKIRHNIIPILKDINENAECAAVRMSQTLSEDNDCLEKFSNDELFKLIDEDSIYVGDFCKLHPAIAKRIIKKYFSLNYPDVTLENIHINNIYDFCINGQGKINLPSGIFAEIKNNYLFFYKSQENNTSFSVNLIKLKNVNNLFSNNLLDCDKIIGNLTVRTREEGDSIRLYNRGCTKSLKKLYCENKIPIIIRDKLPVIADEKGVVWVYNIGVAARCAVSKTTKEVYKIEVEDI